jgi:hypothetical protein
MTPERAKAWIKVALDDLSLFLYPGADDGNPVAYTEFTQRYQSDRLNSVSRKRLYWRQEAGQWKIVMERNSDVPTRLSQR